MRSLLRKCMLGRLASASLVLALAFIYAESTPARDPHCELLKKSVVKIEVKGQRTLVTDKGVRQDPIEGVGSGVLVDRAGHILTAAHVIGQASLITVVSASGQRVSAHPIAQEAGADVAVLQLEGTLEGLLPAGLAPALPAAGDELWTLGHPLGLDFSLSRGVVSAVRPFSELGGLGWKGHILQTDAAINPGASGGGLFDSEGRLVGIAASILSRSGGFEGVGFGIALDAVKDVLSASPCMWLGVDAISVPPGSDLARALGAPGPQGYLVQQVFPGSAAEAAGLRPGFLPVLVGDTPLLLGGDLVLKINGLEECRKACRALSQDKGAEMPQTVALEIFRGGKVETVAVRPQGLHVEWGEVFGEVRNAGD